MPCFICSKCGCIENTAAGDYWTRREKPLCSECSYGKWHGLFPKRQYKKGDDVLNPIGMNK